MATSMDADSEVLFKEKREEKGVKAETTVDDATLRFDFRASTPAMPALGRGAWPRVGDGEEQRRVELNKFSLRPEKYDGNSLAKCPFLFKKLLKIFKIKISDICRYTIP